jgi:hypothetical protein
LSSVGIPTLGRQRRVTEISEPSLAGLRFEENLESVRLTHHLTERLDSLTVIFENRSPSILVAIEIADLAGDTLHTDCPSARPATMARKDLPPLRRRQDDERHQDPVLPNTGEQPFEIVLWITVKRETEAIWFDSRRFE